MIQYKIVRPACGFLGASRVPWPYDTPKVPSFVGLRGALTMLLQTVVEPRCSKQAVICFDLF
jgi:hypothetical protein